MTTHDSLIVICNRAGEEGCRINCEHRRPHIAGSTCPLEAGDDNKYGLYPVSDLCKYIRQYFYCRVIANSNSK